MKDTESAVIRALKTHYLFAGLDDEAHARVLPNMRIREFSAGQTVFHQGDDAPVFFLLHRGMVKLYRLSDDGHEKIMRLIQPGQSFAEAVMFMDVPRYPVHAQGLNAGVLVAIETATYLDIMRTSFTACRAVLASMAERIQGHWDEIEALALQNSRYRVVHYLLSLAADSVAGATTVRLPVSKSLIAAQLAITPETLSRILRLLHEDELIEMRGYQLRIPDLAALRGQLMA